MHGPPNMALSQKERRVVQTCELCKALADAAQNVLGRQFDANCLKSTKPRNYRIGKLIRARHTTQITRQAIFCG